MNANVYLNNSLIIHSQNVKSVSYFEDPNTEFDINDCEIDFNLLRHKENRRDFKIQLFYNLKNFNIFVEGHFEFEEEVKLIQVDQQFEIIGLSTLIPFLRHSVYTITSVTKETGVHIPLINLPKLIQDKVKQIEIEAEKIDSKPKRKNTVTRRKSSRKKAKK